MLALWTDGRSVSAYLGVFVGFLDVLGDKFDAFERRGHLTQRLARLLLRRAGMPGVIAGVMAMVAVVRRRARVVAPAGFVGQPVRTPEKISTAYI